MTRLQQRILDVLKSAKGKPVTVTELSILLNKPKMAIYASLDQMARDNSAISFNGEKAYIARSEWKGYLLATAMIMTIAYAFVTSF
ncbi:hypothetical protein ACFFJY_09110 [Fictibacillus aquaticus]|uniref:hypothetical protein n=1 Tax=Fictibacillus aquaticus TaxID=2021314 RepID=UPI0010553C1A|nr:hypothetical protein [Fictibacillus aquaticus]